MADVLSSTRRPAASTDETLEEIVSRCAAELATYQDEAYAARYRDDVERIAAVERVRVPGRDGLARAVARNLFKLMAIKDEYEVARLQTDPAFLRRIEAEFSGVTAMRFHFAPPALTGGGGGERPRKREFGPWIVPFLKLLAASRRLRGTPFDVFGRTAERRAERATLAQYRETLREIAERLDGGNHGDAVALAALPDKIRGFGHVRARHLRDVEPERLELLARLRGVAPTSLAAE